MMWPLYYKKEYIFHNLVALTELISNSFCQKRHDRPTSNDVGRCDGVGKGRRCGITNQLYQYKVNRAFLLVKLVAEGCR